ncbi:MAG: alpha/beta fold hydrolase [Candidatus Nanopelagicales bacterium]
MSAPISWQFQVVPVATGEVTVRLSPSGFSSVDPVPVFVNDRPRAVLIHGLGGSSLNWIELMGEMDGDLAMIALDLPGFGFSPPPRDGDYHPRGHANAVIALLDHLNGQGIEGHLTLPSADQRFHVFGNSLGGNVAVHVAALRPDLVASLTLLSPALPSQRIRRGAAHMPLIAIPGIGERIVSRYLKLPVEQRVNDTVKSVYARPERMTDERRSLIADEVGRRDGLPHVTDATLSSLRGLIATFVDPRSGRVWRMAEGITCPTLAVYGQRDQLVDAKAAHRITRHFADSHVVVLPDSGHVAMMEHPTEVADAWRRFIGHTKEVAP